MPSPSNIPSSLTLPTANRLITNRYRNILRGSGALMVLSAALLAGTSLIFPVGVHNHDEHRGRLWQFPFPLTLGNLPQFLDEFFLSSQSHLDSQGVEENLSEDDLQRHRRLKRIVKQFDLDRERKAERARARAKQIQPGAKKELVPILPPNANDDPERLIFPSLEAEKRYYQATNHFQDIGQRQRLDPLGEFQAVSATTTRVPFEPQVEWLGVIVDAGRHYFPIPWLKRLIVYLHRLRFNMIHFRLTDDQAFNLQLESYPGLAFASVASTTQIIWNQTGTESVKVNRRHLDEENKEMDGTKPRHPTYQTEVSRNEKIYTPKELRELVAFAKDYGISIIPEVNVPGHAGAWAGIPGLVVNCPEFVCNKGYGLPLNVTHPQLKPILKGVIGEVLDIFDNPPLFHLGGDEIFMSSPCFQELDKEPFNSSTFEAGLLEVLEYLGYPQERVMRWEETGLPTLKELHDPKPPRTGTIEHFWQSLPGPKPNQQTWSPRLFFASHDLYMDVNHESGADSIYNATVANFQLHLGPAYYPTGIVAGTFELGTDFWMQRNVAARLIAVAMGAARLNFTNMDQFWNTYKSTCQETLGLDASVCDLQGYNAVTKSRYQRDWSQTWTNWTGAICDRMTEPNKQLVLPRLEANYRTNFEEANKHFWRTLKQPLTKRTFISRHDLTVANAGVAKDSGRTGTTTGVLLDLVNAMRPTNQTENLLKKFFAPLGISLVQLRLADNHAFAIGLENVSRVGFSPLASSFSNPVPTAKDFVSLVQASGEMGIELFPEITLSTNAGGWLESGFALHCPQTFCNASTPQPQRLLATNIGKREFLPVVYSVVRELLEIFSTSQYIHLGSDERKSNLACFEEDGRYKDPPLDAYERDLAKLLQDYLGLSARNILRWENQEKVHYPGRTGDVTHYRSTSPFALPEVRMGEPFFVTINLLAQRTADGPHSLFYEIYKNTRQLMAFQPLGILAEIRILDEVAWFTHYVGLRLVAFVLGTRFPEQDDYTPEEFQVHLVKECRRVQFDHCEKILEGSITVPNENLSLFVESESFRKQVCDKHAEIKTTRKARAMIN